jgi:hypothetical protein
MVLRFGGLLKFGVTPLGGVRAGPLSTASSSSADSELRSIDMLYGLVKRFDTQCPKSKGDESY